jgi:hypothetical protein
MERGTGKTLCPLPSLFGRLSFALLKIQIWDTAFQASMIIASEILTSFILTSNNNRRARGLAIVSDARAEKIGAGGMRI